MKVPSVAGLLLLLLLAFAPLPTLAQEGVGETFFDRLINSISFESDGGVDTSNLPDIPDRVPTRNGEPVESESCGPLGIFTCERDTAILTDFSEVDADGNIVDQAGNPVGRTARTNTTANVNEGIVGYILRIGYFINAVLIPLLFGIALLVFLINIVRYFIFAGNTEEKLRARTLALYGIGAFVFLVSIWGIVNLFVVGLNFDRQESLCPDYLGTWCKDKSYAGRAAPGGTLYTPGGVEYTPGEGGSGRVPTGSIPGTPPLVDFGCGSGVDLEDCEEESRYSALAELVFGEYEDEISRTTRSSAPGAINRVVTIPETTSCRAGFETLVTAAGTEVNQAAYLLYTDSAGTDRWVNVTHDTLRDAVTIHQPTIANIVAAGGTDLLLVHTHPQNRPVSATLSMDGHGPTVADLEFLCQSGLDFLSHAIVDWNGVWALTPTEIDVRCPYAASDLDRLPVIETLYALSMVEMSDRAGEFARLMRSELVPERVRDSLSAYENNNFSSLATNNIQNLVATDVGALGITISRYSAAGVCSAR